MILDFLINKVYAQTGLGSSNGAPNTVTINNPLGVSNFADLIACVIKYFVYYIAPLITVVMVLYGAFQMLTAGGEPDKFSEGRKTVLYAIIGYALVLVAAGLVGVIQIALGGGTTAAASCSLF